ncbi:aminotransferase class I/II-fold pyridoxal phosphate-dependent enzyme [Ketobacter sp. MCCC 1A13808]|uniref:aminotransferase class I/II-fold pyridoxal phosphate-dependent enzyme n=1 Tax=Ketobacter sp. MCCC 1A13808 TaxID=2602738 RepID=UPI0012ECA4B7|nr:aminotransferase class I/II-fold pyridoxal phosphate-dependent enzyme [Ketobacter sp. MCCC 1A13808]MVF12833.1 aminotransferase class I/II-fold pyridoxal phosphate-dependent enzyme [Ketobacter sp. MCCC 1A13808]
MSGYPITIPYLVPDMPAAAELLPFLSELDDTRWYSNFGPLAERLNNQIKETHFRTHTVHTLLCNSGTAALELGLKALNLKPGSQILIPSFTFPASANAVENCGFIPVFCDVDPVSWVLTPEIAKAALGYLDFDAVLPVAALGRPLPAGEWSRFFAETKIPVLIDAAPALGTQQVAENVHVAYSMHATKAFGVGEGGVLASYDGTLIQNARRYSNFGMDSTGMVVAAGTNAKISEYHAAVGLAQIERWQNLQLKRARIEMAYLNFHRVSADFWSLQSYSDSSGAPDRLVSLPSRNVRSAMPVKLHDDLKIGIKDVQALLATKGIETRLWYNPGLHNHGRWQHCRRIGADGKSILTVVDHLNNRVIGLPFHNFLAESDIRTVVHGLWQVLESDKISALTR